MGIFFPLYIKIITLKKIVIISNEKSSHVDVGPPPLKSKIMPGKSERLKTLLPTSVPKTTLFSCLRAAKIVMSSSGSEVESAVRVNPKTEVAKPKIAASELTALTVTSPPIASPRTVVGMVTR